MFNSLYALPDEPPLPFVVPDAFKGIDLKDFRAMFKIDGILMLSFIGDILASPWPARDDPNQEFVYEIRDAASATLLTYMVGYDAGLVVSADDPETLDWYRFSHEEAQKAYRRIVEARVRRDQERRKSQA